MKKNVFTFIFFMVFGNLFSQVHTIQNNTTSTTILPSSISSTHNSNVLSGQNNLALGHNALSLSATMSFANVALGPDAMNRGVQASSNVAVGHNSLYWSAYSGKNVSIGYNAMKAISPISGDGNSNLDNVAVGYEALKNLFIFSSNNVAIGSQALINGASNSVAIGYRAGYSSGGQINNIFIGQQAGFTEMTSNKLYIENSNSTTPLIGGDFVNDIVGINMSVSGLATNPDGKLQVNGNARISGSINASTVLFNANISLTNSHYKLIYTGGGLHTITLPSATGITGREYLIVNHGGGSLQTSLIFKTGNLSSDQYILPNNVLHLISDGTDWRKIN